MICTVTAVERADGIFRFVDPFYNENREKKLFSSASVAQKRTRYRQGKIFALALNWNKMLSQCFAPIEMLNCYLYGKRKMNQTIDEFLSLGIFCR